MQAKPAIELKGVLERADFSRFAYSHMYRKNWIVIVAISCALLIFLMLTARLVLAVLNSEDDWPALLKEVWPIAAVLMFWVFFFLLMPRRGARRQFTAQPAFSEETKYTFGPEGITCVKPSSEWTGAWSLVLGARETKSLFLLYLGLGSAVIVPKRFFRDSAEMEGWRELVTASIHPKQIEKPGLLARFC